MIDRRHGCFRFDVQTPATIASVSAALLEFRAWDTSFTNLSVHKVSGEWSESDLTHDTSLSLQWESTAANTVAPINAQTWLSFDVSSIVSEAGTHAFGLQTTASGGQNEVCARESDFKPRSVITPDGGASSPTIAKVARNCFAHCSSCVSFNPSS